MSDKVIAKVAGKEVMESEFNAYLQGLPREQQAYISNPQFKEQCQEQFLSLHLFAQLGEEDKLDETEEYARIIESARKDILAQLAIREVLKTAKVSDDEIQDYYQANQSKFTKGETVSTKHILVDSEEKCKDVLAVIENGEKTFEDAAKEYSSCPSSAKGGDLGTFGKGQMVKEFEDVAFHAEIGHVEGPVKTQFGYHLIKVEKKNEAGTASFEEVKGQIYQELMVQKQNDAYKEKVKELKEKYLEK